MSSNSVVPYTQENYLTSNITACLCILKGFVMKTKIKWSNITSAFCTGLHLPLRVKERTFSLIREKNYGSRPNIMWNNMILLIWTSVRFQTSVQKTLILTNTQCIKKHWFSCEGNLTSHITTSIYFVLSFSAPCQIEIIFFLIFYL